MNRGLKFLAALIFTFIVIVPFLGLDGLPRDLRKQIDAERAALTSAQKQFQSQQTEVLGDLKSEQALFRQIPASAQWPQQLTQSQSDLQFAARQMDDLTSLEKQNHRRDRARAESLLARERLLRTGAMDRATAIDKQADHWVDVKRRLPDELRQMEQNYQAAASYDPASLAATVEKAGADWPDKKTDLESRLGALRTLKTDAAAAWQSSADARKSAAAGDFARLDFPAFDNAYQKLQNDAAALPKQSGELKSLTAQLYNAWDKVLVDMQDRRGDYQQKIRTITTHVDNASAKPGDISSNEAWVDVSKPVYEAEKNDLGMSIAHKAGGKYDIEAERVAQPAGFAYMAPPSQGSNQYGYWQRRDGHDFWVFYGQYALLRDLLFNHRYQPVDRSDWEQYRDYRSRGQTYYGRDTAGDNAPKYGTRGTTTEDRYSGSTFAQRGGFKDSKYANRGGSYSGSKYASPEGDRTPRRFGSGREAEPRFRPSAPRPSYRPRSIPRRFGRR